MGIPEIHVLENTLTVCDQMLVYSHVTMGVPHVVIYTPQLSPELVDTLGQAIENHPMFPNRTNVNFCYIKNRQEMHVFTWERGAGHTLACGTGVTSAFAVAASLDRISDSALVTAEGGELQMRLMADGAVEMTGPARDICSGLFYYE
jgi:diaminopimelate epimerase